MMMEFYDTYGANLLVAVVGVGVALLILAVVLWIIRRRGGSSPFIRGGKNRQPRLQVLDATAVDARRRLVLVRRDNVEHLVMIGGPTDIVIESGIGAIPIVKDVRDPLHTLSHSMPLETPQNEPIAVSAPPKALSQHKDEPTHKPVPQPDLKPAQANMPAPAPRPRPAAATMSPQARPAPSAPQAASIVTPPPRATASTPVTAPISAPDIAAVPKAVAREPIPPAVAVAAVAPAVAVTPAKPTASPVVAEGSSSQAQPTAASSTVAPEPVITRNNAADFLDAARERVLSTASVVAPAEPAAKLEPLSAGENGPAFGDQLTSDFESFLQAEIAKSNATESEAPEVKLEPVQQPLSAEPVTPPVTDKPSDSDVQKEMARIFGEMAVTRDR